MENFSRVVKTLLMGCMLCLSFVARAQNPTYELHITNETQPNDSTYEFDVYLLRTGATPFELASFQFGIGYDTSIANGGKILFKIVSGSSQLAGAQSPTGVSAGTVASASGGIVYKYLNLAARSGPGAGNGTIISEVKTACTSPGTRVATFQVLDSGAKFRSGSTAKLIFSTNVGSGKNNTIVTAYVNSINTTITNTASNLGYGGTSTCYQNIPLNTCNLTATKTSQTNACYSSSNGTATVTLSGGYGLASTGTYKLDNSNSSDSVAFNSNPFTVSGLASGSHTIYVRSSAGSCTANTGSFTISQLPKLDTTYVSVSGCGSYSLPWGGTVSTIGTTNHSHTYTNINGCDSIVTNIVSITAAPILGTLNGTQAICSNGTTTLSSTASGGKWTSGNTAVATIDSLNGVVTPVSAGTATMTYRVKGTGVCPDSTGTRSITVTAKPVPGTLSGTQTICSSGSTVFSSTVPSGTWTSGDTTIAKINSSTGVVTPVSVGTATMTYGVTGTGGCNDTAGTRQLIVTVPPFAGTISASGTTTGAVDSICSNGKATLTTSGGVGVWSASNNRATIDATTGLVTANSSIIAPQTGGIDTIRYIVSAAGCTSDTSTKIIYIKPSPNPGTLSGVSAVCSNGATKINVSGYTVGSSGVWAHSTDSLASLTSGSTNDTIVFNSNAYFGTDTVRYTATNGGCSSVVSKLISITAGSNTGTLGGDTAVCSNDTSRIVTSTVPGVGVWSSGNTSIATINSSTGKIKPVGSGTVTMTYTVPGSGACSTAVATIKVVITAPRSTGSLSGNQAICSIDTTTSFGSSVSGGTWTSGNTSIATINSTNGKIKPVTAGSATMTYTVAGTGGCPDATATKLVTITAAPNTGNISANTSKSTLSTDSSCKTSPLTYSSTVSGGAWSSSSPSVATINSSTGVVTPLVAGSTTITYSVTGTGGCSSVSKSRILVLSTAPTSATLFGTQGICLNNTSSSFSSSIPGGIWSSSDTLKAKINSSGTISPRDSGTVSMTYTIVGKGGCESAISSRSLTIKNPPTLGALSGITSICSNDTSKSFSSSSSGGVWTSGNTGVATINASTGKIKPISAGTAIMTYKVSGTGGCADSIGTRTLTVSTAPNSGTVSGTQAICSNNTSTVFTSNGFTGGIWTSSDTTKAKINSSTGSITPISAGSATITYTVLGTGACLEANSVRTLTISAAPTTGVIRTSDSVKSIRSATTDSSCNSSTIAYSSTVSGGVWTSSNTRIATITSNGTVTTNNIAGSTTLTYTVTGTGGCANATQTKILTISIPPVAGTLSGDSGICSNNTIADFSSTISGGIWISSDTAIAKINSSTGEIIPVTAGSATMTYTVLGKGGCANASATRRAIITTAPVSGTLSGLDSICSIDSTIFYSTASGGKWTTSNTSIVNVVEATGRIKPVNPPSAGTATILYTVKGTGGCANAVSSKNVVVSVNTLAGSLSGSNSLCQTKTTNIRPSVSGGYWTSSNPDIAYVSPNGTSSDGIVYGIAPGSSTITYTVLGTGKCPNNSVTRSIVVKPVKHFDTSVISCSPFVWRGRALTSSVTDTVTISSAEGCDSLVRLNLVIIGSVPSTPSSITQTLVDNTCGQRKYRYAVVNPASNADGYIWSIPQSAGGISGVTLDSGDIASSSAIVLEYASNAAALSIDSIKVKAWSSCGYSSFKGFKLSNTALSLPSAPASITVTPVTTNSCTAKVYRFTAPALVNNLANTVPSTGWVWSFTGALGANATIDSGEINSKTIRVLFSNNSTAVAGDSVIVAYTSDCGNGKNKAIKLPNVKTTAPSAPSSITISPILTNVCTDKQYRYTAPAIPSSSATSSVAAVTERVWSFIGTLGASAIIDSGDINSQRITVNFGSNNNSAASGDSVKLIYGSDCGYSTAKAVKLTNISTKIPSAPASITATPVLTNVCSGKIYRYTAPALPSPTTATATVASVSGRVWTLTGNLGNSGVITTGDEGSAVIEVTYSSNDAAAQGDSIKLVYTTACGTSPVKAIKLSNVSTKIPSAPSTISITPVLTNVCTGKVYRYTAPALPAVTSSTATVASITGRLWSFSGLGTTGEISSGNDGSAVIEVTYPTNDAATVGDSVKLQYITGCGNSTAKALKLTNLSSAIPVPASITTQFITDACDVRKYRYTAPALNSNMTQTSSSSNIQSVNGYLWSLPTGTLGSTSTLVYGSTNSQTIDVVYSSNDAANGDTIKLNYTTASCGDGSAKAVKLTVASKKCTPIDQLPSNYGASTAILPTDDEILQVKFGSLDNSSDCSTSGTYTDYSTSAPIETTTIGETKDILVSIGFCPAINNPRNNTLSMYIDWNRDGDFLDASETKLLKPFGTVPSTGMTINTNVTVPNDAVVGKTKMRFVLSQSDRTLPTGAYYFGETEDYVIDIVPRNSRTAISINPTNAPSLTVLPSTTLNVRIFPNPTTSNFNMQVISADKEIIDVKVMDVQGRVIKTLQVTANQSTNIGSDLKPGTYFVEVKQGKQIKSTRLLKF